MVFESPIVFYGLALLIGLCVGSFLNVVIYRIPKQLQAGWERDSRDFLGLSAPESAPADETFNIAKPTSHCPKCQTALKPWHNIPLISYLVLRGRCSNCSQAISVQYPLVELISGLAFILTVGYLGFTIKAGLIIVFCLFLLSLTVIDIETQLLPDILTYPFMWLGLLANTNGIFTDINSAVMGAIAGYLSLWTVYWAFKLFTGKEGMGHGDFKLLAALGAWMGWQMLPLVILLSSFVGAIIGLAVVAIMGRDKQIPMAFGPYLAIAGLIAFIWGESIINAYLGYI